MNYAFCPKCGGLLERRFVEGRDRLVCSACAFIFYQHSKACAGVLVMKGDKVLLVQRAIEPFKGYWDIPGGFLEAGEAPEAGAVREMKEETGLLICPTEILGIFMDTYNKSSAPTLNICYLASVIGGEAQAGSDVKSLGWFQLNDLPDLIAFDWSIKALQRLQQRFESD